jgi:hypothetical protein
LQLASFWVSDVGDFFWFVSMTGIFASCFGLVLSIVAVAKGSGRSAGAAGILMASVLALLFLVRSRASRELDLPPEVLSWYTASQLPAIGGQISISDAAKKSNSTILVLEARFPGRLLWKKEAGTAGDRDSFEIQPNDFRLITHDGKESTAIAFTDHNTHNPQFGGAAIAFSIREDIDQTILVAFVVPEKSLQRGSMRLQHLDQSPIDVLAERRWQPTVPGNPTASRSARSTP